MTLRDHLLITSKLTIESNVFYQKEINRPGPFEKNYIRLREKENRVYSDEIVKELPEVANTHGLVKEWSIRRISLEKLKHHLTQRGTFSSILELGCGNGWLSSQLATSLNAEVCAVDVNETELQQGARVFSGNQNLQFVYADIFTLLLPAHHFDTIILASSIQYFPDLNKLINRLFELLKPTGEIHILDSPFYSSDSRAREAKKRSHDYFLSLGFPEMMNNYCHHTWQEINHFSFKVLFNPGSLISLVRRRILKIPQPIFPWIVINKH